MAHGTPQTVVRTDANQVKEFWMNMYTNIMQIANAVQDATTHTFGCPLKNMNVHLNGWVGLPNHNSP